MMPFRRFEIHQPASISEAAEMRVTFGDEGSFYGGGTELLLAMRHDALRYQHLIDVKVIPGLDYIELRGDQLCIGATTTHRSLERSELVRKHLPVLAEMESQVANIRVRASGSIGGNLCFAEPHSDPATLLLALDAQVAVEGAAGRRKLGMAELIVGAYETSLAPGELLSEISVPLLQASQRAAYLKFQVHERPTLGLGLMIETADGAITRARVAVGCVSPAPCRSATAEELLTGPVAGLESRLPEAAAALADAADLIDDYEGSADYKRHLIGVFLKRALMKALAS
ncbi:MAG: FAD binding domain-containing protein [Blastocatellia bacterium]